MRCALPHTRAKRNSDSYSFLTGLRSILRNQALMQFSFLGLSYTLEIEDILHQRVSWEGLSDQLRGVAESGSHPKSLLPAQAWCRRDAHRH